MSGLELNRTEAWNWKEPGKADIQPPVLLERKLSLSGSDFPETHSW